MPALRTAVLFGATLTTGLGAGLFYAYSCSVMPGLARVDDRSFIEVMRRINVAIVNGWFMLSFLGALVLIAVAGVLALRDGSRAMLPWIVAAAAFQLAMLVITSAVSVPLNNRLAAAGAPDHIADPAAVRSAFEASWVRWNLIRALTCTASFACIAWALRLSARTPLTD
ncbi:anthrone oxygenase family protein [Streptomyces cinerochromogenes]|uniref:anthrone oxygenase family protein n=1 Tax=Streptomyces cinerochromogenes TaxID=66422 RepID=UPI0033AD5427